MPHRGVGGAHRGAHLGEGLAGLVAPADLLDVEPTAVRASGRQFDHTAYVADGDAEARGKFLEPAIVESGGFLADGRGRFAGLRWAGDFVDLGDDAGTLALDLLRAHHPADLGDPHPVAGGELVQAAVLEGRRGGARHRRRSFAQVVGLKARLAPHDEQ
jgi:hypothetical protein